MSDKWSSDERYTSEGQESPSSPPPQQIPPALERLLQNDGFAVLPAPLREELVDLIAGQERALVEGRDRLRQAQAQAETLRHINRHLVRANTAEEMLQVLAAPGLEAGASHAHLFYIGAREGEQVEWAELAAAWRRDDKPPLPVGTRLHLPELLSARVLLANPEEVQLLADVANDERLDDWSRELLLQANYRSLAVIPLSRPGCWIGFLTLGWDQLHSFSQQEIDIYRALIDRASSAVENRHLLAQTQRALADVKRSEQLLRSLVDATPDWVFVKDRHHRFRMVNRSYAEAFHRAAEEFIGKDNLEVGWPEELVKGDPTRGIRSIWTDDLEVMEQDQIKLIPDGLAEIDGDLRLFDVIKIPLHDAQGQVWGLLGVARDMTELKRAEEELSRYRVHLEDLVQQRTAQLMAANEQLYSEIAERKRIEAELRQSQELLQLVMDHVPESICWKDRNLVYLGCNRQFARDAGRPPEQIIGKTAVDMPWAQDADFYHRDDREVIESDTPKLGIEEPAVHAEGEVRWERANKIPLHDAAGQVVGVLTTLEDITERKRMEQFLLHTERLAAMGRLAAALAHEINNPLHGIENSLDLVLDFPLEEARRREYLCAVRREIERLCDLSRQILDFARPPKREQRLTYLTRLVDDALALAEKELLYSHIQVDLDLPDDLPPVLASPDQLTQVFLNLIINAIEEMPGGGHLQIAARQRRDRVELTFADDGPGIPPDRLPMVFEPFYTTKEDGTGLGLAISHSILQQYGGTISVQNAPGGGAVFAIGLPLAQPAPLDSWEED